MQLSPGSKLLQLGPEKGVEPVLSLLQHACDRDTPAHLRSRFASDFNDFIKQWQVAYEADAVASAEHVQALQKVSSPLTVHRAKSAGEGIGERSILFQASTHSPKLPRRLQLKLKSRRRQSLGAWTALLQE
jgi:hypothetical protein